MPSFSSDSRESARPERDADCERNQRLDERTGGDRARNGPEDEHETDDDGQREIEGSHARSRRAAHDRPRTMIRARSVRAAVRVRSGAAGSRGRDARQPTAPGYALIEARLLRYRVGER